jgi:hypothetical protein
MIKNLDNATQHSLIKQTFINSEFTVRMFSGNHITDFTWANLDFLEDALNELIKLVDKTYPGNNNDWGDWPGGPLRTVIWKDDVLTFDYRPVIQRDNQDLYVDAHIKFINNFIQAGLIIDPIITY